MTTKELINHTIVEIRIQFKPYSISDSFSLEQMHVEIKLNNGLIINFPFHAEAKLKIKPKFSTKSKKIFPQSYLKKLTQGYNRINKIRGQNIKAIWKITDDFGEEICGLELSKGHILVKGPMSPMGTGNAELFLYNGINSLNSNYENKIEKIHGA